MGVWNKFDEIEFDKLPNQFVLKCTHDSGSYVICKDKNAFDKKKAKVKLEKSLKRNYFWGNREWPYKNVVPRIIAEPFIESLGKPESTEYKLTCFNGKVVFTTICTGIAHSKLNERKNDFYDRDFNMLPFWTYYKHSDNPIKEKPWFLDTMISYAEELGKDIPYVRVDFYLVDNKIYFGETTFFTWGGYLKMNPEEWDLKLGEMLELPNKSQNK